MGTLLNRRRYMGGGVSPYDEFGYIKDGKVFHLDGINKGATDGSWVDLVGGKVFTNSGAVSYGDHFYFANNAHMDGESMYGSLQYTIEVCFAPDSSFTGMVFQSANQKKSEAMYLYLNQGLFLDRRPFYSLVKNIGNNTLSLNENIGIQNGQVVTRSSSSDFYTSSGFTIGYNGYSSGRYFFKGKIYSIRLYNKRLTQDEILNNQSVDNTRFSLGLTITTI